MTNSSQDSSELFASMFERGAAPRRPQRWSIGDEVEATVVTVGSDAVFLDLDGKREAFIDRAALVDGNGRPFSLVVGDTVVARVTDVGWMDGGVRLAPVSIKRQVEECDRDDAADGAEHVGQVELVDASGPRLATGMRVKGEIVRVEAYGVFVQIEGTTGRQGRGLVPASETGLAKGTDLRKKLPVGKQIEVKILSIADDGKIRLSIRELEADDERSSFKEFSGATEGKGLAGFGTLAAAFARSKPQKASKASKQQKSAR